MRGMRQIDLNEAKKHLTALIETALGGEEIVITQDDQSDWYAFPRPRPIA